NKEGSGAVVARNGKIGEADTGLLQAGHQPYRGVVQFHLEFGREEFRHALMEVEEDSSAEQAGDERGEYKRIRHRVDLHKVIASAQVQCGQEQPRAQSEARILQDVEDGARSSVAYRQAVGPHSAPSVIPTLT